MLSCVMSHMTIYSWRRWNSVFVFQTILYNKRERELIYIQGILYQMYLNKNHPLSLEQTGMINIEFVFLLPWTQLQPGMFWTTAQVNEGSIWYTLQVLFSTCAHNLDLGSPPGYRWEYEREVTEITKACSTMLVQSMCM